MATKRIGLTCDNEKEKCKLSHGDGDYFILVEGDGFDVSEIPALIAWLQSIKEGE